MNKTDYPQPTAYTCPECGKPIVLDEWTHTTADHEGSPDERTGVGHYCVNKACPVYNIALDDDFLFTQDV